MREEADDGSGFLELCLELRNQGERFGGGVVQVKNNELGPLFFGRVGEAGDALFIALEELYFNAEFAAVLVDLGVEEEIFNEEENAHRAAGRNCGNWQRGRVIFVVVIAIAIHAAISGDGGSRRIGYIAVDDAIAVIHGTDKLAWALLLPLLFSVVLRGSGVAWLVGLLGWRLGREFFLFLAPVLIVLIIVQVAGGLRLRLRDRGGLHLLGRSLCCGTRTTLVLPAPAPAPMPLRLTLAIA